MTEPAESVAMENDPVKEPQVEETLILLKKIWVFFLVGLYAVCLYNEYRFPGAREGNRWRVRTFYGKSSGSLFRTDGAGAFDGYRADTDRPGESIHLSICFSGSRGTVQPDRHGSDESIPVHLRLGRLPLPVTIEGRGTGHRARTHFGDFGSIRKKGVADYGPSFSQGNIQGTCDRSGVG